MIRTTSTQRPTQSPCRLIESVPVPESMSQQNSAVHLLVSTPHHQTGGVSKRMKAQYDSVLDITKQANEHVTIILVSFFCFPLPLSHPRWKVLHPCEILHEVFSWNGVLYRLFHKPVNFFQHRIIRGGARGVVVQDG